MKYDPQKVRTFAESLAAANGNLSVSLMEKDVWITYILRELTCLALSKYLAFKGGTCLVKCYFGYYRFSEDIDLTWFGDKIKEREFRKNAILPIVESLGLRWYQDENVNGIAGTQSGNVMSYFLLPPALDTRQIKLKITVAFNEKLEFKVNERSVMSALPKSRQGDFRARFGQIADDYFDPLRVPSYSLEEIACEKIRAMLTRKPQVNRSRDIVDLYRICADLGGLPKSAPSVAVRAKLSSALKIPSYRKEFARTTEKLEEHLAGLARQTRLDSVFLSIPPESKLIAFAQELSEYLKGEKIIA